MGGPRRARRLGGGGSERPAKATASASPTSLLRGPARALQGKRGTGADPHALGARYSKARRVDARVARILAGPLESLITVKTATRKGRPTITWRREPEAIAAAAQSDGIYALATNIPGKRLSAGELLRTYKGQQIVERRHRDYKQTLKVRPIILHNDDRIYALTSIVGIALLIFGLIETELRKQLGDDELLPGLLPENRAAKPTGRNVLSAFQGLGLTYTRTGIQLDRLTHTQRRVLELLQITPPWPEQQPAHLVAVP